MSDETAAGDGTPAENFLPTRTTAEAEGTIGGESHASYGFFAVEGQRLTVRLSWDKSAEFDENSASVSVSSDDAGTFTDDSGVFTTTESGRESTTTGTVPRTGAYHLSVVAHPAADYRLRLTLE